MTFDEMIPDLFRILSQAGARPDVPIEAEEFFTRIVSDYTDRESCCQYIEEHLFDWFRCFQGRPDWIQDPDWPWAGGKPMVFVGSMDAPPGAFHDDARFFLF